MGSHQVIKEPELPLQCVQEKHIPVLQMQHFLPLLSMHRLVYDKHFLNVALILTITD